ncbi:MAG: hypothetical protein ACREIH_02600, partial [Nitrospiraceae bacterium]
TGGEPCARRVDAIDTRPRPSARYGHNDCQTAIGRKNWLFFQREGGGRTASTLMSLLMTAKAAGVHLGDYFKDVLLRISEPGTDVKSLTPHGWKERFEPEVSARRHDILNKLVGAA